MMRGSEAERETTDVLAVLRYQVPPSPQPQPPKDVTVTRRVVNIERHETHVIYRCTADGETIYSNKPCPRARIVDTRPAVGSYAAPPKWQTAITSAESAVTSPVRKSTAEDAPARRDARCTWLAEAIDAVDAQARLPLHFSEQDRLRERRRVLVDEQYALKC